MLTDIQKKETREQNWTYIPIIQKKNCCRLSVTSLCRGLEKNLKCETHYSCLKKYHENGRHLCLVASNTNRLCLINLHILIYQHEEWLQKTSLNFISLSVYYRNNWWLFISEELNLHNPFTDLWVWLIHMILSFEVY